MALHQRKYEKDQRKHCFDKVPQWKWKNFEKENRILHIKAIIHYARFQS